MKKRILGRTGIQVSEVGLGCEHLQGKPYETVEQVVHAALAGGVNILDVFMSEPEVRSNIGRALQDRRQDVVLQGHIGATWQNGQYVRSRDVALCREFIEDFLTRVGTDYIDIGMIHYVDQPEDLDVVEHGGVLDYAKELKEKGFIRAIGMSSHDPLTARLAVEHGWVDVLMFSINPAYDILPSTDIDSLFKQDTWKRDDLSGIDPSRMALYEACAAAGTAITVMKTYGAGVLYNPELSPFGCALRPEQLIHYALSRPAVASALIGCQTLADVEAALAYETVSDAERDFAETLGSTAQFTGTRQCVYCNHCLPCPVEINVAAVNRALDGILTGAPETHAVIREQYAALSAHAGDCIACGGCESRCPFGVPVIERMQKAADVFGK